MQTDETQIPLTKYKTYAIVLTYFMHLKHEGRFLKIMLLVAVATLTAFIALTFVDVWYRGEPPTTHDTGTAMHQHM
jgi:hypothetical protein